MYKKEIFVEEVLSKQQLADLIELESKCNEVNQTDLKFHEVDFDATTFHVCSYIDGLLVGYFSLTQNYIKNEFLLWGALHPDFEETVHFNEILKVIIKSEFMRDAKTIKILNDPTASNMKMLYCEKGAVYEHTIYDMRFKKVSDVMTNDINIREATMEDLKTICEIGVEAFGTSEEDEISYNTRNIENDKIKTYLASTNSGFVGMVSVKISNNSSSIADLAVIKEHQKKGYGRSILCLTIKELLKKEIKDIRLGVETNNVNALNIYKATGFEIHHSTEWLLLELDENITYKPPSTI